MLHQHKERRMFGLLVIHSSILYISSRGSIMFLGIEFRLSSWNVRFAVIEIKRERTPRVTFAVPCSYRRVRSATPSPVSPPPDYTAEHLSIEDGARSEEGDDSLREG